jgi:hypothetical protein
LQQFDSPTINSMSMSMSIIIHHKRAWVRINTSNSNAG